MGLIFKQKSWSSRHYVLLCMALLYVYSLTPLSYSEGLLGIDQWIFRPSWYWLLSYPWTTITYAWLHADLLHVAVNLYVLTLIWQVMKPLGNRIFYSILWASSISGALFYLLGLELAVTLGLYVEPLGLIGSSPILYGFITFITLFTPRCELEISIAGRKLLLWHLFVFICLCSLWDATSFLGGTGNIGGLLSHIGGAIAGGIVYLLCGYRSLWDKEEAKVEDYRRVVKKVRLSGFSSLTDEELAIFLHSEEKLDRGE